MILCQSINSPSVVYVSKHDKINSPIEEEVKYKIHSDFSSFLMLPLKLILERDRGRERREYNIHGRE